MTGLQVQSLASILSPTALTVVDNVRVQLGMPVSALTTDVRRRLERLINGASTQIEEWIGFKVLSRSYEERKSGRGESEILTDNYPVISISELWIDNTRLFTDVSRQVPTASFLITDKDTTIELLDRQVSHGRGNVKIVYVAGYSSIPADIGLAADLLCEWLWRFNEREDIGRTNKSKGDESVVMDQGLPKVVAQLLSKYKRKEFAGSSVRAMENL